MKSLKSLGAAIAVAGLSFVAVPAAIGSASGGGGGGGGGGTVAGECGTLTTVSASNVTLGSNGLATPLAVRASFKNCSIYSQRYYLTVSEPNRPTSGGLNGPQVTCTAAFTIFDQNIYGSGSSGSIGGSGNITPTAVADPASCKGTHTLAVALRNRTDAKVMSTLTVNYTVG